MVFNITEHVQGVHLLLRFWRSDGVLNLNTHFYSVVFDLFCIFGKIPTNNSSFKLKSFTNAPLETFFNGGHFSTCQTRKKSTPVTFFLHMRHVFLRPGVISLRRKMTPRSIFDGGRYSSLPAPSNLVLSFQSYICCVHRTPLHALPFVCLWCLFDTIIA